MKVYERDNKINFVDENNVFLGYDTLQDCCEDADWFISKIKCVDVPSDKGEREPDLTGFVFDVDFFEQVSGGDLEEGGMAIFRIVNGDEEAFVHIYNSQNGYYSHGFTFGKQVDVQVIRTGCL